MNDKVPTEIVELDSVMKVSIKLLSLTINSYLI